MIFAFFPLSNSNSILSQLGCSITLTELILYN